jgi:hypothetical protein
VPHYVAAVSATTAAAVAAAAIQQLPPQRVLQVCHLQGIVSASQQQGLLCACMKSYTATL